MLNPSNSLINVDGNTESVKNTLFDEIFYPVTKYIKEKIVEYNAIPTNNFINESYFLYNKSNLIKKNMLLPLTSRFHYLDLLAIFQEKHRLQI